MSERGPDVQTTTIQETVEIPYNIINCERKKNKVSFKIEIETENCKSNIIQSFIRKKLH